MKRIISILLSAIMVVTSGIIASAGKLDSIFDKIAVYTPAERAGLIAYARPFVTTNAGVDAALSNLNSMAMQGMFISLFGEADEDMMRRMFLSCNCIKDETELRVKYADIFQGKVELSGMNSETRSGINALLDALFEESSSAKKIFTEDGITAGVVANMLTIIPKINGNKKLLKYTTTGFSINAIDQTFENDFNNVWNGYESQDGKTVTYEKLVGAFADGLNKMLPEEDGLSVAKALANLNVCNNTVKETTDGGNSGGPGADSPQKPTEPEQPGETDKKDYVVLESFEGVPAGSGTIVKVNEQANDVVTFETDAIDPMIYEVIDGEQIPVKYSIATETGIKAVVAPNGVYVIRSAAYPFTDANGWGKSYISALYQRGIINGRTETTFEPDASITREEFVKLIVGLFELEEANEAVPFTDVAKDAWYYSYVAGAYKHGIVSGIGDNLFGTGAKIKRQDMAKILCTVLETNGVKLPENTQTALADFTLVSDYAKAYVLAAYDMGIISGDDQGNFNPDNFATRQEAAKMIYGMLHVYIESLEG